MTWRDFNCDLARLSQCLEDNYLIINDTKTQAIIVGKSNYNYEFTLKSSNILTVDELKLLRVTINSKLTFSSHIKLVLRKIHAQIAAMRRVSLAATPRLNYSRTFYLILAIASLL